MKSFPDYAGLNSTNGFTAYLLTLLSTRIGGAPIPIRIGGISMDNSRFDNASTTNTTIPTGENCKLHTNVTIGALWLYSFANLPAFVNPRYTLQIPLARKDVANGIAFASASVEAMGEGKLDALEIGNEPNFYPKYGCGDRTDRDGSWGPVDYAREWTRYAGNLMRGVEGLEGGE
ncbi:hypothetical protein B0J12DRAFT_57299 [Macrophomina phaseolina]|uniref:Glycoside hydrolase family 79 protein n=1 Tax=Macrophomina phaseolina TaxID=35725 RepID=A0ABQ8GFI7_9PEZI|nr:hypothetical protein B0J12DRAFT_57299 [Macrophomina phaseolina]